MSTIESARVCRDCGEPFAVTAGELEWWRRFGERTGESWHLPARCTSCRFARRQEAYGAPVRATDPDVEVTCCDCGSRFLFAGRDKEFFASRGFARPRRCRPCRQQRQSR
jgi:hypothetical protein